MLKLAIASVFLGANLLGFSVEMYPIVSAVDSSENYPVYLHIRKGNADLYYHDYFSAFKNFSEAELIHDSSLKYEPELHFWICIGKAIASDNLGLRNECEESIGSLVLIAHSDISEEYLDEENPAFPDIPETGQFLKQIVSRAKSPDLREFMGQMSEEW